MGGNAAITSPAIVKKIYRASFISSFPGEGGRNSEDHELLLHGLSLLKKEDSSIEVSHLFLLDKFPGVSKGKVLKPKAADIKQALPRLRKQIKEIDPDVIICLGALPFKALVPNSVGGEIENRLKSFPLLLNKKECPVFVTYSSFQALVRPEIRRDFFSDLETLLIKRFWIPETREDVPVYLINKEKGMSAALNVLSKKDVIGLDIETRGLSSHVLTIGFSV